MANAAADAETAAGSYFTDVSVNPDMGVIDVYLASAPAAVIKAVAATHPGLFAIHASLHNQSDQVALQQRINGDIASLKASGIAIRSIWPQSDGTLRIGVSSDLSSAAEALTSRYGADWVSVVTDSDAVAGTTYRASDVAPWNGGDFIYHRDNTYWGDCSAGSPVHDATTGHDYMLTAAHCIYENGGAVGDWFNNGYVGSATSPIHGSNTRIGNVTKATPNSGTTTDSALIDPGSGGTSDVDFDCAWDCQGRNVQGGSTTNPKGTQTCASGAFEGQICSIVIRSVGGTICPGGFAYCVYPADLGSRDDGAIVNGGGDSGGPMYVYSSTTGKLLVQGMIDAAPTSSAVACASDTQYSGSRTCYTQIYWVPFAYIQNDWNLAVNTG